MKTISSLENELFGLIFEGGGWRQVMVVVGSRGGRGGPRRRSASYRSLPNLGSRGKKKKFGDVPLCPLSLLVLVSKQRSPMKTSTYTCFRRRWLWCCDSWHGGGAGSGAGHSCHGWCWWPWLTTMSWWWQSSLSSLQVVVVVVVVVVAVVVRSSLLSVVVTGCGHGVLVVVVEEFEVHSSKIEQHVTPSHN